MTLPRRSNHERSSGESGFMWGRPPVERSSILVGLILPARLRRIRLSWNQRGLLSLPRGPLSLCTRVL